MHLAWALALLVAGLSAAPSGAQDVEGTELVVNLPEEAVSQWEEDRTRIFDAGEVTLSDFLWIARPVVVFADSPNDPSFRRQMELLAARPDDLVERDVVLIVDTDPDAESELRLLLRPRGFMLAILGKDGQVKLRKPLPWSLRELTRSIDKMPLRQQEINERRGF